MVALQSAFRLSVFLAAITPVVSVTVRITPLGDSITGGPGCWRALLWQNLQKAGVTNTDFVGTQPSGGCAFSFDGEHEGHGGFKATGIVADKQLPGWLAYSRPDIVMMELGTNDVWSSLPTADIIASFGVLVDQMRAQKSTMRILVAQITPMNPGGCSTCNLPQKVVNLNTAIAAWGPGKSTTASPITVVDCWTGFNTATDFTDGVHPNDSGNAKLAKCWFEPLKAAIALVGGSALTTSVSK
ncbi:SGNH hydrolase-type esterase domain-containing protein [Halenospora varia]|nr:SGNH hydrolase-type esterase domain-containing protein [Halenospora varia]